MTTQPVYVMVACRTGWRQDVKGTGRELTTDLKAKKSIAKLNFSGTATADCLLSSAAQ